MHNDIHTLHQFDRILSYLNQTDKHLLIQPESLDLVWRDEDEKVQVRQFENLDQLDSWVKINILEQTSESARPEIVVYDSMID